MAMELGLSQLGGKLTENVLEQSAEECVLDQVGGSNRRQDKTLDDDLNDSYSLSNILRVMKS